MSTSKPFRKSAPQLIPELIDAAEVTVEEAARISVTITMMHGRIDKPCPAEQTTLVVAEKLPTADVILLSDCRHHLPRERTRDYLAAARVLFDLQ